MAIVLGKPGKCFSAEQAAEHIGGYLVFSDITARDIRRPEMNTPEPGHLLARCLRH